MMYNVTLPCDIPSRISAPSSSSSAISSISLDSQLCSHGRPDLRIMLQEYTLSVNLRPRLTVKHIGSIVDVIPFDFVELRKVKGFGQVCRDVHGKKILQICKKFSKELIRWDTSSARVRLSSDDVVPNDISRSTKLIDITSKTILDFCRPNMSEPSLLTNTMRAKIRDLKNNFSVQYNIQQSASIERPRRSLVSDFNECTAPDINVQSEMDRSIISKLLENVACRSRRLTIEDAMRTPPPDITYDLNTHVETLKEKNTWKRVVFYF